MKNIITSWLAAMAVATVLSPTMVHGRAAFVAPRQSRAKITAPISPYIPRPNTIKHPRTSLEMGYQLPPSGPNGPMDEIKSILPTIATGALVLLFFASPLGGIFFAVTNSLFVLALLTPFILFVGFQVWSALYTIEAPCPSCGVIPIKVLKNGEPGVCPNCGAFSRANEKGDGLELCNNPYDMMNEGAGGSMFDALFGQGGKAVSDFDVVSGQSKSSEQDEQAKAAKKRGTIIDVDVERD